MSTKVRTNRTKQVTATDGTALVILDADESHPDLVFGSIQWKGNPLAAFPDGTGRTALRHLANAILEAVDASEWNEATAAEVEAPGPKFDTPASDLAALTKDINNGGARRPSAKHEPTEDHNGDPSCTCGFAPTVPASIADGVRQVRNHVLSEASAKGLADRLVAPVRPAGRPIADRPQA